MIDFSNIVLEFLNLNSKEKYNEKFDSLSVREGSAREAAQQLHWLVFVNPISNCSA